MTRTMTPAMVVLLTMINCSHAGQPNHSEGKMDQDGFKAERISKTSTITLNGSVDDVFPLFGPIGEMEWADGWNPEMVYPGTNSLEEHMVFKTHSHGHGGSDYTWTVTKYSPAEALIEYTIFATNRLWSITIKCHGNRSKQTTQAEITYAYTGLTEEGNRINAQSLQRMFSNDLKGWEMAINHYLQTGTKLKHH